MGIAITSQLTRGSNNTAPFPLLEDKDAKVSYVIADTIAERNAIDEWRRKPKMTCYVIETDTTYRLGLNVTVGGQVWTEVNYGVPDDVLTEDEILDVNGFIKSELIQNIFLNSSFVVANEAAMLALTTLTGNFIIRTDTNSIYVKLNNDDPATLVDFAELTYPGAVLSVNGSTGAVTINLAGLIDADPSIFDDYLDASDVIIDMKNSIIALQNTLAALDLSNKADLVAGTVPLAQLPYVFSNGITRSTNAVKWGGDITANTLIDDNTTNTHSVVFGGIRRFNTFYVYATEVALNATDIIYVTAPNGVEYGTDPASQFTALSLIHKQYADQRVLGTALADPNADRIIFWDDSAGGTAWLTPSADFSITGTTLSLNTTTGNFWKRSGQTELTGTTFIDSDGTPRNLFFGTTTGLASFIANANAIVLTGDNVGIAGTEITLSVVGSTVNLIEDRLTVTLDVNNYIDLYASTNQLSLGARTIRGVGENLNLGDRANYSTYNIVGTNGLTGFRDGMNLLIQGGNGYLIAGDGNGGDVTIKSGVRRIAGTGSDGDIKIDTGVGGGLYFTQNLPNDDSVGRILVIDPSTNKISYRSIASIEGSSGAYWKTLGNTNIAGDISISSDTLDGNNLVYGLVRFAGIFSNAVLIKDASDTHEIETDELKITNFAGNGIGVVAVDDDGILSWSAGGGGWTLGGTSNLTNNVVINGSGIYDVSIGDSSSRLDEFRVSADSGAYIDVFNGSYGVSFTVESGSYIKSAFGSGGGFIETMAGVGYPSAGGGSPLAVGFHVFGKTSNYPEVADILFSVYPNANIVFPTLAGNGTGYMLVDNLGIISWDSGPSVSLTDGDGTTANGSSIDLGGLVSNHVEIDDATPRTHDFLIGFNSQFNRVILMASDDSAQSLQMYMGFGNITFSDVYISGPNSGDSASVEVDADSGTGVKLNHSYDGIPRYARINEYGFYIDATSSDSPVFTLGEAGSGFLTSPRSSIYQYRSTTSNGTLTTIFTLPTITDSSIYIVGYVQARRTGGASGTNGDCASYRIEALYKNVGGTLTAVAGPTITAFGESQAGWDLQLSISTSNILVRVQGATNNDVTWDIQELKVMETAN